MLFLYNALTDLQKMSDSESDSIDWYQEAIEYEEKNLSIAKETGDRGGEGWAYCQLGNAYHSLGQFQEAIEYYKKDLSIAKEAGDRANEGTAHSNLGDAYDSLGQFQEAIEYHKKGFSIFKELGDKVGQGRAYCNLGNAYSSLGKFQEAMEYHKEDLSIAKELGDMAGEGRAYCNLGNVHDSLGQFQEAIECHKKHLSIAKEMGDRSGEGTSYGNLGCACQALGQFHEAIEYHNKNLSISKELGNRAREANACCNLGIAYRNLGQFQEAIEYHKKDLSICKEIGNRAGEGKAYCNLGIAYHSIGQFQEALECHKKDLSIAKEVGVRANEGMSYGNLGVAYINLEQFEEAVEYLQKSLAIAEEVGDRVSEGGAYCNLGNTYQKLGQFQEAIEYHKNNLSITKEVGDRAGEGKAYCNLGNDYYSLGQFQDAIDYHKKDLDIAKEVGDRAGEGMAYCNLGDTYVSLGQFQEASECFQSSVNLFDITRASLQSQDIWKISCRDRFRASYTSLWSTLVNLEKTDEALCAAEQGRAQALVDSLKTQYGFPSLPSSEPKDTISYISNEVSTNTVFLGLRDNNISFWVLTKGKKAQFRQRKIEGKNTDKDSITVLLATTLKTIGAGVGVRCENRSLDDIDDDLSSNTRGEDELAEPLRCTMDSLQPLYDAIIGPIADLCQGDELIIVPDGPLCLAPLPALSESIRIRTVPSLTSLKLIMDSPDDCHSKSGSLLVGDPCLEKVKRRGKPMYSPLPCAKREVEMIGEILKTRALTGSDATKKDVLERLASVSLVHIAAHGRKETGEIALAPNPGWEKDQRTRSKIQIPKEKDYMLKMSDVQAVRLRARLVVLSCCHSGRGEVKSEGVVGIARAFLAAGARSVLVTLWAIDDEATMEFMKNFYQHLADGKSASVAVHRAMKSLRDSEKFCAAKYWAPFALIGDDVTFQFAEQDIEHCQ